MEASGTGGQETKRYAQCHSRAVSHRDDQGTIEGGRYSSRPGGLFGREDRLGFGRTDGVVVPTR